MHKPTKDDLTDNETTIRVTGRPDDLGRVRFDAFWLDDYLPPDGVRGQVFHANIAEFVRDAARRGRKVTALDEHTHQLLDSIEG